MSNLTEIQNSIASDNFKYGGNSIDILEIVDAIKQGYRLMKQDERRKGSWVYDEDGMDWGLPAWRCSECGQRNDMIPTIIRYPNNKGSKVSNPYMWAGSRYCPNCGVKMEEG